MSISTKLMYAEEGEALKYLTIRKIQKHDEQDDKEREQMGKVRCFLTHIKWRENPRERGGWHHLARVVYPKHPAWRKGRSKPNGQNLITADGHQAIQKKNSQIDTPLLQERGRVADPDMSRKKQSNG